MVLVNDIVVFAFTALMCLALRERGLNPRPYLLALAGSANAGSTASLIGYLQNILTGDLGNLGFFNYVLVAAVPALADLDFVFAVTALAWRKPLSNRGHDRQMCCMWKFIPGSRPRALSRPLR
jgi:Na+/H+ antiporter NhaD/arsenite permease-like protein